MPRRDIERGVMTVPTLCASAPPCARRILEYGRFTSGAAGGRPAFPVEVAMVPPIAGVGSAPDLPSERYPWITPQRLSRLRGILLALTLFFGLVVYVFHTLGSMHLAQPELVHKLRGLGLLTWVYALVQMLDMRFWNSRWAQRRRSSTGIPDTLHGWLFGQMLASFGI